MMILLCRKTPGAVYLRCEACGPDNPGDTFESGWSVGAFSEYLATLPETGTELYRDIALDCAHVRPPENFDDWIVPKCCATCVSLSSDNTGWFCVRSGGPFMEEFDLPYFACCDLWQLRPLYIGNPSIKLKAANRG